MIFRHLLNMRSHPTWVRGLKHVKMNPMPLASSVAPYVGAWIETHTNIVDCTCHNVAPYVGAWIETSFSLLQSLF